MMVVPAVVVGNFFWKVEEGGNYDVMAISN
jgi:hypothetical protein